MKNVSNETARKDFLLKGTNQALRQRRISPFHTQSANHSTIKPSVGWFGIHSPPLRTDVLHSVYAVYAPLTRRSPSWQSPSMTIPVTWAVGMGKTLGELRALLAPPGQGSRSSRFQWGLAAAAAKYWSGSKFPKAVLRWFSSLLKGASTEF